MKAIRRRTPRGGSARGHTARLVGALVTLAVALLSAGVGVGVAGAAEPTGSASAPVDAGANGPTTTIEVEGGQIELIPATSYELPPTASAEETAPVADPASPAIEVQGVSSTSGPTAAAGVDSPNSWMWFVLGGLVVLAAAVWWLARSRRVARH